MTDTPTPDTDDFQTRVDRYLRDAGLAARVAAVTPLAGDASTRRYARVTLRDEPSQVLAVHPEPIDFATLPFVNVARLFAAMPLPVPRILGHSDDLGIIALEDLGDVTLQAHLDGASNAERTARYRQAVEFLHTLQHRGRQLASTPYIPYGLAFDTAKLNWELGFFMTHFLEAYRSITLTAPVRAALEEEFLALAKELASEPRVLCHRDYHSRTLMLHGDRLHIIDFQDARMGPDTYDLVSLLRDSYVDFTDAEVEALIDWFLTLKGDGADRSEFRRRFDVMALQRNLKALGTFGFQATARGKREYVQYIPRTVGHVRAGLARLPRFERLRRLLDLGEIA
jgi:aminoglycoside/choline kinase family phosphotransferase